MRRRQREITLSSGSIIGEKRSIGPVVFLILLAFVLMSLRITDFRFSVLLKRGGQFWIILSKMFPPDFGYLPSLWKPLLDTIKMSITGSAVGALLAVPFAAAASSNIVKRRPVVLIFRLLFSVLRTIPTLITALIATFIFGLGTKAGVAAIALFTFSYVGKLLYEEIETADMAAYEAMLALGNTKPKAFVLSVVPQVLPLYLSSCLYCFEGNVRYASVLGYVGAGGIGLILNSQIGWRNYDNVGMILLVLFVTVVIIEHVSSELRRRLDGENKKASPDVKERYHRRESFVAFTITLLLIVWASSSLLCGDGTEVNSIAVTKSILHGIFHPSTSLLFSPGTDGVPYLLLETVAIAFLGTLVGAVISVPFAFLSSANIVPRPLAAAVKVFIMAVRTVPAFVYGLMFIRVTGPGPFAGVLTMSICSVGMISKMLGESVGSMDRGILEFLDASGCDTPRKIMCGIIPQIAPSFMSIIIYRFDMNLRDTAVLGLVGAGGIGAPLIFAMNGYKWDQAGAILFGLVTIVLVAEWMSSKIRMRLTGKKG